MSDHNVRSGLKYFAELTFPFHAGKYKIGRGQVISEHCHDFVELVYVVEGNAYHEMAGLKYELKAGDLFVIEPNTYHGYVGSGQMDTTVYNLLFDRNLLYRELHMLEDRYSLLEFLYLHPFLRKSAKFQPHLSISGRHKLLLETHLATLLHELRYKEPGYQLMIKTRLIECMVNLSRYCAQHVFTSDPSLTDAEWMDSIISLLEQNYDQPYTLEQMSRLCGMSVTSFSTKFKRHTGKTLVDYRNEIRILEACRMIGHSNEKIANIALEVGFDDLAFFYKVFRKKTSQTPTQYRNSKSDIR